MTAAISTTSTAPTSPRAHLALVGGRDTDATTEDHDPPDARAQLRALWDILDDFGAVVRRRDIAALSDHVAQALCDHESARVRALVEGESAGCWLRPSSTCSSDPREGGLRRGHAEAP